MIYIHIDVLQLNINFSERIFLYNELMKITLLIIAFILWKLRQRKTVKKTVKGNS